MNKGEPCAYHENDVAPVIVWKPTKLGEHFALYENEFSSAFVKYQMKLAEAFRQKHASFH